MSKNSNNKTLKKKTKDQLIEMINDLENEVTRLQNELDSIPYVDDTALMDDQDDWFDWYGG